MCVVVIACVHVYVSGVGVQGSCSQLCSGMHSSALIT